MSYQAMFSFAFVNLPGLTLNAKLFDSVGSQTGSTITTGFVDLGDGAYQYLATIPDGHIGTLKIYDSAQPSRCIPLAVNPQEIENADVKTSSLVASLMAFAMMDARQFQDVIMDLWAVVVGNASANDATNPTSISYQNVVTGGQVTHILDDTTRTID